MSGLRQIRKSNHWDSFVWVDPLGETNSLFRDACSVDDLQFVEVQAGRAAGSGLAEHIPRLIYCAATDWNSRLIEKLLARPGDMLLHDPHFVCDHQPIRLMRAGLPMARAVYVVDIDTVARQVEWLGAFPVS